MSDHSTLFVLLTDKKSSYKKIPLTPFKDKISFASSFDVSFLSKISIGPILETFLPGKNFKELGFGVFSTCTNIMVI